MTAATVGQSRVSEQGSPSPCLQKYLYLPVAASSTILQGSMVINDISVGYAKEPTSTIMGHQVVSGVARGGTAKGGADVITDDATAVAAGDVNVKLETGVFEFINDTTKALVQSDAGQLCYAVDNQTLSSDSLDHNRAVAGVFLGFSPKGLPLVAIGDTGKRLTKIVSLLANASLALLQYTVIKLVSDSGTGKADSQTSNTAKAFGVLLNAPASGAVAYVAVHGPAPLLTTAAGYTAAAQLMATAGGAAINGTTGKYSIGDALQSAGASETKMAWVDPGYVV